MNKNIIETEVDALKTKFELAFPESYIFKKQETVKKDLINEIISLFNDDKITSDYEEEMHSRILNAIQEKVVIKNHEIYDIKNLHVKHMKNLHNKYGDELGTFLLMCNNSISRIYKTNESISY